MLVAALLGWLAVVSLSVVWFRSLGRLRSNLNRGIHELRRPLQHAFLLSSGSNSQGHALAGAMERALASLDDLDSVVNRCNLPPDLRPVDVRRVMEGCLELHLGISQFEQPLLRWDAQATQVLGNPDRLRRIFDNLIENAVVHGADPVWIRADQDARSLRVAVGNAAADSDPSKRGLTSGWSHGHGLGIVRELVGEHGGRLVCRQSRTGYEAVVELPLLGA